MKLHMFIIKPMIILILFSLILKADDYVQITKGISVYGNIKLKESNRWIANQFVVNDTMIIGIEKVSKYSLNDSIFLRICSGKTLSNFALKFDDNRMKLYSNTGMAQFGNHSFYNIKRQYFSLDDDTAYFYNYGNLKRELSCFSVCQKEVQSADFLNVLSIGIRLFSVVPFLVAVQILTNENAPNDFRYSIPITLGVVGCACLIGPSFTLIPLRDEKIQEAILLFNGVKKN